MWIVFWVFFTAPSPYVDHHGFFANPPCKPCGFLTPPFAFQITQSDHIGGLKIEMNSNKDFLNSTNYFRQKNQLLLLMFLYIRKYEIWFCVEIFLQKLIHMDKPQTPPPPCGFMWIFHQPPPPSQSIHMVCRCPLTMSISKHPEPIHSLQGVVVVQWQIISWFVKKKSI